MCIDHLKVSNYLSTGFQQGWVGGGGETPVFLRMQKKALTSLLLVYFFWIIVTLNYDVQCFCYVEGSGIR